MFKNTMFYFLIDHSRWVVFTKSNLRASVPPQACLHSRNGHETSRIPHAETSLEVLQIHRTRAPRNRRVVRIVLLQCLHGKCLG